MTTLADDIKRLREFHAAHRGEGWDGLINTVNQLVELVGEMQDSMHDIACNSYEERSVKVADAAITKSAPIAALAKGESYD